MRRFTYCPLFPRPRCQYMGFGFASDLSGRVWQASEAGGSHNTTPVSWKTGVYPLKLSLRSSALASALDATTLAWSTVASVIALTSWTRWSSPQMDTAAWRVLTMPGGHAEDPTISASSVTSIRQLFPPPYSP